VSSRTVARICRGCSSVRTISSPRCAVERQCTRRRSSPCRYSRVETSSSPLAAALRDCDSPEADQRPPAPAVDSGQVRGTTTSASTEVNDRVISHIPKASVSRSRSGPTG
jgi:hypothetical protein